MPTEQITRSSSVCVPPLKTGALIIPVCLGAFEDGGRYEKAGAECINASVQSGCSVRGVHFASADPERGTCRCDFT